MLLERLFQSIALTYQRWKNTVVADLEHMHSSLQEVLNRMSLPPLPLLQTAKAEHTVPSPQDELVEREDPGPSCDNSPRVSPRDDALPHVPIESLYQITRLRALRSDDTGEEAQKSPIRVSNHAVNDFISNGLISIEDADRLVNLYLNRIDHFMSVLA
jgi:hypothetical protein